MSDQKAGLNTQQENEIIETKAIKVAAKEIVEQLSYEDGERVLVIRHDAPKQVLKLRERELFSAAGVIDTVSRYLEKRVTLIDQLATTVIINRDAMTISLHSNETDYFGDKVKGKLTVHPDFNKFDINTHEEKSPEKLGDFLRMNRSVFVSKTEGLKLVALLKGFEANVNKIVEEKQGNNGDRKKLMDQTVTHNLPEAFKIKIGLFKGQEPKEIEVEIIITVGGGGAINCKLESPEAQEFMDQVKNEAIDKEIDKIREIAPNVLIIEE